MSLKDNIKIGIAVCILYLFFLLANIPASFVISKLEFPPNIQLQGITGTIWSGKARNLILKINGISIELGNMGWELSPVSLLAAQLSGSINIQNGQQYLRTELSVTSSGFIELKDTYLSANLDTFQALTYGMPFSYAGNISGEISNLAFKTGDIISINGNILLSRLRLISPEEKTFGDFLFVMEPDNKMGTMISVKDKTGPVAVDGKLTINKNTFVNIDTRLSSTEKSIDNMLAFLGQRDKAGKVNFNYSTRLIK